MAAPQSSVRVCLDDRSITFQVLGWGQMSSSSAVRQCAEEALDEGVKVLRFDLRHCTYLDSTFLGTLLFLRRATRRYAGSELVLVCPSPPCCALLRQLGVDELLPKVAAEELRGCWRELFCESEPRTMQRAVVDAHQELASCGGVTGAIFEPVARCLMDDLKKEQR
jgi:anti-anti-sigma regulatory factor